MQSEMKAVYALRAAKAIDALKRRGMEGYWAQDREAATRIILSLIPEGSSVAWGGSTTLARDMGFYDLIRTGPYKAINRDAAKTPEEIERVFRDSLSADVYLMGSNAISMDGQLVNVDARGNRVAALAYGPRSVIVAAGCNKLCPDLESAMRRAREEAAPPNAERLGCKTACRADGLCHDCLAEECICCQTLVTRKSRVPGRIKVVLVGEDLGF